MNLHFRTELLPDYEQVFDLHQEAYGRRKESLLLEKLRKIPQFIPELSIVAENDKQEIVAHVLFTPAVIRSSQQNFPSLIMTPLSVRPDHQRQQVGSRLMDYSLELCQELGYSSVISLNISPFLSRYGFKAAERWNIQSILNTTQKQFMIAELRKNALKNICGTVECSENFETA